MSIPIKTPEEIEIMRENGKILARVLEETLEQAKAGLSTYELDQIAEEIIRSAGGVPSFKGYHGFPGTLCTCKNEVIVHGIPRQDDILAEGDLLTIDCGVYKNGFHSDAARSVIIGTPDKKTKRLLETAYNLLNKITDHLKPNIRLNEIGHLVESTVSQAGYHIIPDLTGHGIGQKLHEAPLVLNYAESTPGPLIKPGMTLAIEPIFSIGTEEMITLPDNWTLITADKSTAVQVENTYLITETGNEILTPAKHFL